MSKTFKRFRVITDNDKGFQVQSRAWWFPFFTKYSVYSHKTLYEAKSFIEGIKSIKDARARRNEKTRKAKGKAKDFKFEIVYYEE